MKRGAVIELDSIELHPVNPVNPVKNRTQKNAKKKPRNYAGLESKRDA